MYVWAQSKRTALFLSASREDQRNALAGKRRSPEMCLVCLRPEKTPPCMEVPRKRLLFIATAETSGKNLMSLLAFPQIVNFKGAFLGLLIFRGKVGG